MTCRFAAVCSAYGCRETLMIALTPNSGEETLEEFCARAVGLVKAEGWDCDRIGFLCRQHVSVAVGARL